MINKIEENGIMPDNVNKKNKSSALFWYAVCFTGIFSLWAVINPDSLTNTLWGWVYKYHDNFSWFTIAMPTFILLSCGALAFSKYGKIKLGKANEAPEFSTFSWMAMLFTAGIGVGLVNFGVAEPLIHYLYSPQGLPGGFDKVEAAKNALSLTMFNWGLPAWSIYTISGLVIGYFTYHRGAKFLPGTPIEEGFKDKKWGKPVGKVANIVAAGAASLTMAASIGLGVFQVKNGIKAVTGMDFTGVGSSIIILLVMFAIYTIAAVSPVQKGMKILGDINVYIAVAILAYVFLIGRTDFFMGTIFSTFKATFTSIVPISFENYAYLDKGWFKDWPNTTLIWWISWTPFLGIFIARISKGRTIREIVLASILVPTAFLIIWFSVFGGYGLFDAIVGNGEIVDYIQNNPDDVYLSFIMVLQQLPMFPVMGTLFIILILVFLSTSATSAVISLSMITSDGVENAPPVRTIIWSVITTMVAFANVVTGTLNGVKAVAVVIGIPYMFFLFLSMSGMVRQMRKDVREGRV
ncbi:glycine betaine transporter OpuD [Peptoclostridium acidaminophilum DSM 3953]|uniref:Glycine betaine transporter OpuD n=1 Tax=Peptoclostridium acidaminophilum DSM 3953 TaxID=1286171 RepID=W8TE19_PEPAC|nr:BCCT family transporter [Peptoclostridium acidaminophilum]AHM56068.1 glycine betaine transporter OpuD [Peptoclostridium acidaminophilum DSM 3953]